MGRAPRRTRSGRPTFRCPEDTSQKSAIFGGVGRLRVTAGSQIPGECGERGWGNGRCRPRRTLTGSRYTGTIRRYLGDMELRATLVTDAGMHVIWDRSHFGGVADCDTWSAELEEDAGILRHVTASPVVP